VLTFVYGDSGPDRLSGSVFSGYSLGLERVRTERTCVLKSFKEFCPLFQERRTSEEPKHGRIK
jgi:hypothetical protein